MSLHEEMIQFTFVLNEMTKISILFMVWERKFPIIHQVGTGVRLLI